MYIFESNLSSLALVKRLKTLKPSEIHFEVEEMIDLDVGFSSRVASAEALFPSGISIFNLAENMVQLSQNWATLPDRFLLWRWRQAAFFFHHSTQYFCQWESFHAGQGVHHSSQWDHFKFASTSNLCIRNTHHQTNSEREREASEKRCFYFYLNVNCIYVSEKFKKEKASLGSVLKVLFQSYAGVGQICPRPIQTEFCFILVSNPQSAEAAVESSAN